MNPVAQASPVSRTLGQLGSISVVPWFMACIGLLLMYVPTIKDLSGEVLSSSDQSHLPIVFALSIYLFWSKSREALSIKGDRPARIAGWSLLIVGCLLYTLGRSQNIQVFEVGSLILNLAGLILILRGPAALRSLWFAFFFLLFLVPLPSVIVDTLTQPMKIAVSHVAEHLLRLFDYPVARWGVILHVGPYQLMVADACAGLTTLLTLEAIGLLYLNLVRYASVARNVALAILIVPISFAANVIRVIVLTLITFHFGDEAGQGFLHGFAGIVLFLSALFLIIGADTLLRYISPAPRSQAT